MLITPLANLTCPHDGARLELRGRSLVCARGHSFDIARENYVNLLPVQDKASRDPGDSKEMVAARHRFLDTGAYRPIADAVATQVIDLMGTDVRSHPFAILDAGCGEGYYLQHLAETLARQAEPSTVHLAGIDISKWAVRAAAKRAVPATWVVASNRRPPFVEASVDLILCLFGFPVWPGFASVQPVGGHVLMIDPGPDHLIELRRIIYPEVRASEPRPLASGTGYSLASEARVSAVAHVPTAPLIADLLAMTPHDHRASVAGRADLAARARLDITIDIILRVFRRAAT